MNPMVRNILATLAGLIAGAVLNGTLINLSGSIIPPPEGADLTTVEGIRTALPNMTAKHFIMPFLAHALGTLLGAFIAAKFSATHHMRCALIIGAFFLLGGIIAVSMIPAPMWFNVVDLVFAYLPMAYLGGRLANANV